MENVNNDKLSKNEQLYQLTTLVAGRLSLQEVLDKLAEAAVKITSVKACSLRLVGDSANDMKIRSTFLVISILAPWVQAADNPRETNQTNLDAFELPALYADRRRRYFYFDAHRF